MSRHPLIVVSTLLAVASASVWGEDQPSNADLQKRMDALEQQVRDLKAHQAAPAASETLGVVKAGPGGFVIASADDTYTLHIGGYAQVASKVYLTDDDRPENNSLFVKRMRVLFEGSLGQYVGYFVMADLATGNALLQDANIQLRIVPGQFVIQAGKFKEPTGLERLQSDAKMLFIERSLATQLLPDRDVGVQAFGSVIGGKLDYALGMFDGSVDAGSRDTDNNDDKAFAGRVFITPFKGGERMLKGLGFGIAGTVEEDSGTAGNTSLPVYKTSGESVPGLASNIFTYRKGAVPTLANTVVADGWHWRLVPQAFWYAGPFGIQGEYVTTRQSVNLAGNRTSLHNTGWAVQTGWVLTGEDASYTGVIPKQPFDVKAGTLGAWEVALRIARLDIDSAAFPVFADPAASVHSATCYGVGVNWYLSRNLKLQVDVEDTRFDGGAPNGVGGVRDLQDEQVVETQFQVQF